MEEKLIVALEIGSSKVKGAIGSVDATGSLTVKAIEEEKLTDSVRYGLIRNVAEVSEAITEVIKRLESREPGRKISGVYLSIGGRSLMSQVVEFERRLPAEMEITSAMIEDISKDALQHPLEDRKVVDVTPREFRVDNSPTTRPVGTYGHHLQAKLNVISLRNQIWRNLNHVVRERLNLLINDFFVRQIAEADLVLLTDEKRLGCVLVDFGAETTTISIYKHGVLQYLATLPMGSRNITRDITSLNHLEERAEELKIAGGNAQPLAEQSAPGSGFSGGARDYADINNYVSARAGEIIANIAARIKAAGFSAELLPAGIVIVGRGARLTNFNQRLQAETGMKVRAGVPGPKVRINDSRITPSDAVDVISILAAASEAPEQCMPLEHPEPAFVPETEPLVMPEVKPEPVRPEPARPAAEPQRPIYTPRPAAPAPAAPTHATTPDPVPVNPTPAAPAAESEPEEQPRKPGFGARLFGRLASRVAELLSEPADDDDEDTDE
ncbi:MAG: cell division protein FtsA [Duncaniella sp.]|nr:cell division protein FtsA [Duncaniella sp.]